MKHVPEQQQTLTRVQKSHPTVHHWFAQKHATHLKQVTSHNTIDTHNNGKLIKPAMLVVC